jgi:hypothetical protein
MISWVAILSSTKHGLLVRVEVAEADDPAAVVAVAGLAGAEDGQAVVVAVAAGVEAGTVTAVIAVAEAAETVAGNLTAHFRNLSIEPGSIFRSPFFIVIPFALHPASGKYSSFAKDT